MRYEILKGEKSLAKGRFELGSIASKSMHLTIYATETNVKLASFFSVDYPNHKLVGRVSVNSLCQQGRIFALSVNRHSVLFLYILILCELKNALWNLCIAGLC